MKRFLFFLFLFFQVIVGFSVELIPQKILLTIVENNKTYEMNFLLRKAILARAKSLTNLYIFPDDETELNSYGIKDVNSKVLMEIVENKDQYTLMIYEVKEKSNSLISSYDFGYGDFVKKIDEIADYVIFTLAAQFPPKEKKQLTTIETTKKKLSIFEKEKPTLTIGIGFNFENYLLSNLWLQQLNGRDYSNHPKPVQKFSPFLYLDFEYIWFLLSLYAKLTPDESLNYQILFEPAIGLFRNLIFVGPFLLAAGGNFPSISFDVYTLPPSTYVLLKMGIFFRINITKDYYLSMGVGFYPVYDVVRFISNDSVLFWLPFSKNEGSPFIFLKFNFKVTQKISLIFSFDFYEAKIRREWGTDEEPLLLERDIYLREFGFEHSSIGLGVSYEF